MELKQLEIFCKIADYGSINEAARKINMSQPPLSYQIKQLEGELGVELFTRSSRGVELTKAGKLLYARASSLLEYARSTKAEVAEAGKKRVLRLGITSTTVSVMLPYITEFSKKYPDVNFEVRDGATYELLEQLLDGIIDVSAARTPMRTDEVETAVLASEPMIAVSPYSMRVENEGGICLCDLSGVPLILYRRYRELILSTFTKRNIEPDVFCICDDARDALLWVKEGLATAIFPMSMKDQCEGLRVQKICDNELETQILLIRKKNAAMPQTVHDFWDICAKDKKSSDGNQADKALF